MTQNCVVFEMIFSYFPFFQETCVEKCCIRHGLPLKCLEEKLESQTNSHHNETHRVITMVMSRECHEYHSVLKDCKSECIEEPEGN